MKTLILAALLTMGSATVFAEGRFYIGGSWGYSSPGPVRVYGPPPPPPAYYGYGSYGYVSRPPYPGPGFIWIDGYYDYYGRNYMWRPGYWARRPHARAMWVRPYYQRGNYYGGYWRR